MTETMKYNQAKSWQIILFPLAGGVQNFFLVLMMFASYLAAGGYGIAVAVASMIITGSRILDAVTDPIIALLCDKLNTKFGRVRILLFIAYSIMSLSVLAMFFVGVGHGILVFISCYVFYIIGYTILAIAMNNGNAILTNDPKQRPKAFRWQTIYSTVLSSLVSVYLSMVLAPRHGGLSLGAFQEMCLTVVLASGVLIILSMIAISSKDKPEAFINLKRSTKVSLKDSWDLLKNNRALQLYIVAATSDKLAFQTAGNAAINTMLFGIIIGNYAFHGQLTMINLIPTLLLIFSATHLAGKTGTKQAIINWSYISIAVAVILVLFMVIVDPSKISVAIVPTVIFVVLNAANSACKMAVSACTGAMLPDIIDYELSRSGNFMPATVGAVYSFVDKFISSFATTIVGFCVAAIGYTASMPQPGDPSSTPLFWMTMVLWMGLPIIGFICSIVALKFYPLSKEKMVAVQTHNHEAKAAQ
jgi:Na+/melibiose symporter-like transporter